MRAEEVRSCKECGATERRPLVGLIPDEALGQAVREYVEQRQKGDDWKS